jgi:hypothetical protein
VRLSSRALAVIATLALLAAGRLVVVTRQYVAGIEALQRVEFRVTGVQWDSPERLVVGLTVVNDAPLDVSVESIRLSAFLATRADPTRSRLGATANRDNPYSPLPVAAHGSAQTTRVVTVLNPELVADTDRTRQPLRFEGEASLMLPFGTRSFDRPLSLEWSPQP